ncbi:MAG: hypothetical protein ABIV05_09500 [Actinomycetota bacterium]
MYSPSRPAVFAAGALLALAVVPASSAIASGGDDAQEGGHHSLLLKSSLAGSQLGETVFGKNAGGAPWVLTEGQAKVTSDGRLQVEIDGLIIPALGRNPVAMVTVTLLCNGVIAGTTAPAPLSMAGDAEIEAKVSVPARCLAPVVMVNPVNEKVPQGNTGVFIAVSGQEA